MIADHGTINHKGNVMIADHGTTNHKGNVMITDHGTSISFTFLAGLFGLNYGFLFERIFLKHNFYIVGFQGFPPNMSAIYMAMVYVIPPTSLNHILFNFVLDLKQENVPCRPIICLRYVCYKMYL